jgi:hypothetical protein
MKKILFIIFLTTFISNNSFAETVLHNTFQKEVPEFDCSYQVKGDEKSDYKNYTSSFCNKGLIHCVLIREGFNNLKQLSCFNDNQKINNQNIKTDEEFLKLTLMSLDKNIFSDIFNPKLKEVRNYLEKYKMDCNTTSEYVENDFFYQKKLITKNCFSKNINPNLVLFLDKVLEPSLVNVDIKI